MSHVKVLKQRVIQPQVNVNVPLEKLLILREIVQSFLKVRIPLLFSNSFKYQLKQKIDMDNILHFVYILCFHDQNQLNTNNSLKVVKMVKNIDTERDNTNKMNRVALPPQETCQNKDCWN